MNIFEIGITTSATGFTNHAPFVYVLSPGGFQLASYWTSTFGAPDESNERVVRVKSFTRASVNIYTSVDTLATCLITEQSFFFDFENQLLYVHFEHDQNPNTDSYQYTITNGYNDSKGVIYIDKIEYLPILQSVPSVAQQADIINYDLPAYVNGSVVLGNANGIMDFLIDEKVYGNEATLLYLDPGDVDSDNNATFSDLIELASFYIEDYNFTLQAVTINVQDKRKAENPTIPENTYLLSDYPDMDDDFVGEPIFLAYGLIREIPCTPLNSEAIGNVNFKAAEILTSFGTIQVLIDDIWTTKTATASDLATATFTLSEFGDTATGATISDNGNTKVRITSAGNFTTALKNQKVACDFSASYDDADYEILIVDGSGNYIDIDLTWTTSVPTVNASVYNGARETSGAVRKVKLVNPIGEAVTYASDVIKFLNLRILSIPFVASFYDLTEWAAEETDLETIGILIDEEKPMAEWFKDIQGGANIGFRYEITPDGKRTIRIRDNNRVSAGLIQLVSIFNNNILPVNTDSDTVFAEVKVKYSKSYQSGKFLSVLDDDFKDDVIANYKQRNRLPLETFLTTSGHADDRAANDALDYSEIRPNAEVLAVGTDQLNWKIFEVVTVELEKPDREYFGTRDGLILAIDPEGKTATNRLQLRLLPE